MSLFTHSHQQPDPDKASTEKGPTPDGPPVRTPDDTAARADATAGDADAGDATAGAGEGGAGEGGADDAGAGEGGVDEGGRARNDDAAGDAAAGDGTDARAGGPAGDAVADDSPDASDDSRDAAGGVRDGDGASGGAPSEGAVAADAGGDGAGEAVAGGGWRGRRPALARVVGWGATVLAAILVLTVLLLPNALDRLTPGAFVRIPVEGIFVAVVLLVVPSRARRVAAVLIGLALGLMTLVKFLDMGFYQLYARPFDLVLDWTLLDDGVGFLKSSIGRTAATATVIAAVVLAAALLVFTALAVVRLSGLMARHSAGATRTTFVLGTVWVTCAALGLQLTGVQTASRTNAILVANRVEEVRGGLLDGREFAKESSVDAFGDIPPDQLLTGLRGKNVIFAFIESYGRSALEDPELAPQLGKTLADGNRRLSEAGFSAQSGFLTSPTTGAGSWLAHSTFMSGLWVNNQQRYRALTSDAANSDRLTLSGAFQRTGAWRTVGVMPGVIKSWPEGEFYDFDTIYDSTQLGYKGPEFSWSPVPDQFSMEAFERLEHGKPGHEPLAATIILATSHNPWAPIPRMIGWDEIGDGSIYHDIKKEGKDPTEVWKDTSKARTEYRRAIEYSVNSLVGYLEEYGDDDTVLVVLGDHEPIPAIVKDKSSRDVPISIIARDPEVLDRISDWGWQDGLKPGPKAPVSRMDTFRDRFLTTYGPKSGATPPQPNR